MSEGEEMALQLRLGHATQLKQFGETERLAAVVEHEDAHLVRVHQQLLLAAVELAHQLYNTQAKTLEDSEYSRKIRWFSIRNTLNRH